MDIPHVFRISTISDGLGVSTLSRFAFQATQTGPAGARACRSGAREPAPCGTLGPERDPIRAPTEISAHWVPPRDANLHSCCRIFWRKCQFSGVASVLRARALRRNLLRQALRKRPSHYGQARARFR